MSDEIYTTPGPVDKARLKLWLDALVSGRFKQGKRKLRVGDTHCCLGVACVVSSENGGPGADLLEPRRVDGIRPEDESAHYTPSDEVNRWFGLFLNDGHWRADELGVDPADVNDKFNVAAANMNDMLEWPFERIAEAFAKKFDIEITYPEPANAE